MVPKQESYSARIDLPELHVDCKLMQIHTPRGTRILFLIRQLPLMPEEFRISKLTFHSDLRRRAASRLACHAPLVLVIFHAFVVFLLYLPFVVNKEFYI